MAKKILLADDSITIQKVVELTFSDGDYQVVSVSNGQRAMEKLNEFQPDIILSDIMMPEKNGYELCEYVKGHPRFSRIPVVLLTGTFEPFNQERAEEVRCDAVVTKPFESQSLIRKVDELIAQRSAAATAAMPQVPKSPAGVDFDDEPLVAAPPAVAYRPAGGSEEDDVFGAPSADKAGSYSSYLQEQAEVFSAPPDLDAQISKYEAAERAKPDAEHSFEPPPLPSVDDHEAFPAAAHSLPAAQSLESPAESEMEEYIFGGSAAAPPAAPPRNLFAEEPRRAREPEPGEEEAIKAATLLMGKIPAAASFTAAFPRFDGPPAETAAPLSTMAMPSFSGSPMFGDRGDREEVVPAARAESSGDETHETWPEERPSAFPVIGGEMPASGQEPQGGEFFDEGPPPSYIAANDKLADEPSWAGDESSKDEKEEEGQDERMPQPLPAGPPAPETAKTFSPDEREEIFETPPPGLTQPQPVSSWEMEEVVSAPPAMAVSPGEPESESEAGAAEEEIEEENGEEEDEWAPPAASPDAGATRAFSTLGHSDSAADDSAAAASPNADDSAAAASPDADDSAAVASPDADDSAAVASPDAAPLDAAPPETAPPALLGAASSAANAPPPVIVEGEVSGGSGLSEAAIEAIARRVVEKLGDRILREIAWDVLPDMAELIVKRRIKELEDQDQ